jgi:hypothetical protein
MPRRAAVWSLALLLPLTAACSKREPVANTPVRQRGVAPELTVVEQSPAQLPTHEAPKLAQITETDATPETLPADEAAPDQPEAPPRNLQSELEVMMGSPVNCLQARPASSAPGQVNISLRANIMPSGAVGRGEVSAPGLSPEEVACVRSRLESLRFAEPIENAPLSVSGSLTLTPRAAAPAAAPAADGGSMQP